MNLTKYLSRIPKIAPVPHRTILSVSGTDASLFLNGLLTTQVLARPFFSAILNPQGRVLYDVLVYTRRVPEHQFLLEYDSRTSSDTPSLLTWLKKFVLRSKVKVRDVSHEYDIWAVWNSSTSRIWDTERRWQSTTSGVLEQIWDYEQDWPWGTGDEALHDRRSIGMGERLLIRKGSKRMWWTCYHCTNCAERSLLAPHASDHDVVASEDYLTHRIIHGVAEGFDDMPPGLSFPMDSNLDIMGGCACLIHLTNSTLTGLHKVNFRKGCYVGQELTVRTYHTGVIRKRILPVIIHEQ